MNNYYFICYFDQYDITLTPKKRNSLFAVSLCSLKYRNHKQRKEENEKRERPLYIFKHKWIEQGTTKRKRDRNKRKEKRKNRQAVRELKRGMGKRREKEREREQERAPVPSLNLSRSDQ